MKLRATPVVVTAEASATRLRASLSVTNPVASARVAFARAAVSAVTPSAAVSYVVPVSSIAYIELAVGMYVDETGRYRYVTDTTTAVDSAALGYFKTATPDDFSVSDVNTLSTDKGLSDSAVMSDTLVAVLIFIRDFADTTSLADTKTLLISPAYSDAVTASETQAFSISKALADSFALNDLSDVAGPDWVFSDYTNNAVSTSDSAVITQDKGYADSLSTADSGTLISQGYCDLTYFAEDYVGYNFTF
jgi:hypothetical protein